MSRPATNRIELIKLRKRRELVSRGIRILNTKRDALMNEFNITIKSVHDARRKLDDQMTIAARSLIAARAAEPESSLVTAALAAQREISFRITMKNVWGVKIPALRFPDAKRDPFDRGSAPGYRRVIVDETAGMFETALNHLASSAALEFSMMEVGGAIQSANRKINTLEKKIAPETQNHINLITRRLEELGREDNFRLKRYKKLRKGSDS